MNASRVERRASDHRLQDSLEPHSDDTFDRGARTPILWKNPAPNHDSRSRQGDERKGSACSRGAGECVMALPANLDLAEPADRIALLLPVGKGKPAEKTGLTTQSAPEPHRQSNLPPRTLVHRLTPI